ncbi:MAG: hypothetical protein J6Y04_04415 [Bacteroidaceae bacterium]|nr:hypothetical protein [Bacteroidaceae bacterium]
MILFCIKYILLSCASYIVGFLIAFFQVKKECEEVRPTKKKWTKEEWDEKFEEIKSKYVIWEKMGKWIGYLIIIWMMIYGAINYDSF